VAPEGEEAKTLTGLKERGHDAGEMRKHRQGSFLAINGTMLGFGGLSVLLAFPIPLAFYPDEC
jgi:hypothetical protein